MSIWYDLTTTPTQTVRVGEAGAIETNADPDAFDNVWVARTSGTSETLHGVAWNGERVVAVGEAGVVLASDDEGLTWYAATSGVTTDLYAIDVGDNVFITVGALGVILTSQTGLSWEPVDSGTFFDLWDVTVLNAEYTAVGDNDVIVVGTLVSTSHDVTVAEIIGVAEDESNTGIFNLAANDSLSVDEVTSRGTLAPNYYLASVTEYLAIEEDGETDVGGSVETGFDETTTDLDAVINESVLFDEVDYWQYQGDLAETFFMYLSDAVVLSSAQSTDQWIGNASGVDSFGIDDRPFINNELLSDSFTLSETLLAYYHFQLLENLGISDTLLEVAAFQDALLEAVTITATPEANGAFQITVLEDTTLSDTASVAQILQAVISEGLSFAVSVIIDGELYYAWVVNTETLDTTQYGNFGFESFCELDGEYFATDGAAIYRLSGDDDAGTDIDAEISLGATDFGSAFQKGVQDLYLGFSADGKLILKVVTDEKVEDWYELETTEDGTHGAKVKVGRGLKARYWRIKLRNKKGGDFELDSIRLIPVSTGRRV